MNLAIREVWAQMTSGSYSLNILCNTSITFSVGTLQFGSWTPGIDGVHHGTCWCGPRLCVVLLHAVLLRPNTRGKIPSRRKGEAQEGTASRSRWRLEPRMGNLRWHSKSLRFNHWIYTCPSDPWNILDCDYDTRIMTCIFDITSVNWSISSDNRTRIHNLS